MPSTATERLRNSPSTCSTYPVDELLVLSAGIAGGRLLLCDLSQQHRIGPVLATGSMRYLGINMPAESRQVCLQELHGVRTKAGIAIYRENVEFVGQLRPESGPVRLHIGIKVVRLP